MLYVETEFNKARIPLYKIIVGIVLFIYVNVITLWYVYEDPRIVAKYEKEAAKIEASILLLEEEQLLLEEQKLETHEKIRAWLDTL